MLLCCLHIKCIIMCCSCDRESGWFVGTLVKKKRGWYRGIGI
jgi:hypothetical protein